MRILLVFPWDGRRGTILPPLGLLSIASVLERAGHTLKLYNTNTEFKSHETLNRDAIDFVPDIVGFSATSLTIAEALLEARQVKKIFPGVPVILGGAHSTACFEQVIEDPAVDYVVRGEGEQTCVELVRAIAQKNGFEKILGLSFKSAGKAVHNPPRPLIADLDILPFPAYHLLRDIQLYTFPQQTRRKPMLTLITSRGCSKACVFCSVFLATGQAACWRGFSANYVVDLIELLVEKFGVKELSIQDDNFAGDPERAEKICDGIVRRGLQKRMCWRAANGVRADCVTKRLLQKMKDSGCYHVGFGIESGNQRILDRNGKGETLETITNAVRWASEVGLRTNGSFIIGLLGDTEATMRDTINYAKSLPLDQASFNMMMPIPGSGFFRIVRKQGRFLVSPEDPRYWKVEEALFELGECTKPLLERMYRQGYKEFYSRPSYILGQLLKINSFEDMKHLFTGFLTVLNSVFLKMTGGKSAANAPFS